MSVGGKKAQVDHALGAEDYNNIGVEMSTLNPFFNTASHLPKELQHHLVRSNDGGEDGNTSNQQTSPGRPRLKHAKN